MRLSHKLSIVTAVASVSLAGLIPAAALAAGSAGLGLSPSGGSFAVGSTHSLAIYENGTDVNVVTANLSYDASSLQFLGASCGGAFPGAVQESGGGGAVALSCYVSPGSPAVSGSQEVGVVSFKALAGGGSTAVSFASSSIVASTDSTFNAWNGNTAGGSYSFYTPAPIANSTAPATPAPQVQAATKAAKKTAPKVSKTATYITPATTKGHLSAWIYVPLGLIAAVAGIAYVFRKELAKNQKRIKRTAKNLRKTTWLKAFQRS
ncbi:MAG TPA: cohesin domain-containing protein [Candidatus Nitrosopolaris sp.]|nr:cohesin domain-containing protein [Candidatus Nitrosopolaris sp.]